VYPSSNARSAASGSSARARRDLPRISLGRIAASPRIRALRREDFDLILTRVSRPFGDEWLERQRRSELYVAVAELDGAPVGRVNLDFTRLADKDWALLWGAHVEPDYQSRGIGTTLFLHVEDLARERGRTGIQLAVGKENPRALSLYKRLGYVICGEENDRWSYCDGDRVIDVEEDCWTMRKRLAN
jgi:ribosomal protein S18 acetylase RimI-like enzyme